MGLEAPFNRMLDQVMTDSRAQFLSHRGHVDFPILLKEIRMEFDSQTRIKDIQQPVLIFHSEDDSDVPYRLGWTLYERSKQTKNNIYEHTFPSYLKLGHSKMYKNSHEDDFQEMHC